MFPNIRDEIPARGLALEPFSFVDGLLADGHFRQAMTFCAFLMPRREAVLWLCQALRAASPPPAAAGDLRLLKLAEDWVKSPTETARRAALDGGMQDPQKGACAWAALAAGWSGGNLSSSAEHPVPPPAHLTGHAVKVGLTLLVARLPMDQQQKRIESLVRDAIILLRRERV
jgi:hypothetical protein